MSFPKNVRFEAMIACHRHCCLCHERKHTRIMCHHIVHDADGGPNDFNNCIPLCPDCHAEVTAYNPRHLFGVTPYYPEELRRRRDDWYAVIKRRSNELAATLHRRPANYPHSISIHGTAAFNYSHFDGFYRLGEGNCEFLTRWTKGSDRSIHCYSDGTNVSVALAPKNALLQEITEAGRLHFGSRVQSPQLGQFAVFENHMCRYAAVKILKIQDNTRADAEDLLVFEYWILEDGSVDFSSEI